MVLNDIDLEVPAGSVFSLLGPNGAGKTTTVQILSTLIPADAGQVYVAGHDLRREPDLVRAAIGVTGQFSAVDNLLTGEENLTLMADLHHLDRRVGRRRAAELLDRFDLVEAAKKTAVTYSGGMRRRLDLAMTLVGDPSIIFLDEPTTGLDPRSRRSMWQIIRDLVAGGVTIFLTTQHLDEADQLADRIAVLDQGKFVAEGTADQLKALIPGGHVRLQFADVGGLESAARSLGAVSRRDDGLVLQVPNDGSVGTGITLVNAVRARHGLPPTTARKLVRELADRDQPILCGFSRHIVPRPADWRGGLDLTGFWWPPAPKDFTPPPHLVDFLAAGDRPVFVGFGSMWVKDKDETGSLIRAALRTSGKRAVGQAGWAGLEIDDENVCMIGDVPHAWLFPQMAAAVHHAGAGTTAAALRAGIPSVPIPHNMDQPFCASRVAALGAACAPIPARQLTASRLAAALTEVTSVPSYRARSRELGELVRGEDGHARVVERIAALDGTHNYARA